MRKLILALIVAVIGCDSYSEDLQDVNRAPVINFTFLSNEIDLVSDSVKYSRSNRGSYQQFFTVEDEDENLVAVYYKVVSGNGFVFTNERFTDRLLTQSNGNIYEMSFKPNGLGFNQIEVYAVDQLGESTFVTINVESFENLKPQSVLSVKPKRVIGRYEYTLDASESFDTDEKFGGKIALYQFNINNQIIERTEPIIDYVFGGENIYTIGLKVQDNDGIWSTKSEAIYLID